MQLAAVEVEAHLGSGLLQGDDGPLVVGAQLHTGVIQYMLWSLPRPKKRIVDDAQPRVTAACMPTAANV